MRVVVNKIIQLAGAKAEGGDGLVFVDALILVGDIAVRIQVEQAVAEHLGMNSQIIVLSQVIQYRIGDLAGFPGAGY